MKPRYNIWLSTELHDRFTTLGKSRATLHLLGKNIHGVCVEAIRLRRTYGCNDAPGVSTGTITEAYLSLLKKKLDVGGFCLVTGISFDSESPWGDGIGDAIWVFPEKTFVVYGRGRTVAHKMSKAKRKTVRKSVEINLVAKNFKPPVQVSSASKSIKH
jgi:hypothetical protein